ncbi:MAG: SCO family protein [Bacteroidia bacterium]
MRRNKTAVGFLLGVFVLFSCGQKKAAEKKLLLPVYGEKTVSAAGDTIYHSIKDFSLLNQYKEIVSQEITKNKIYVANFFFATCDNICPTMNHQLIRVQQAEKDNPDFLLLSHTVNPMHDTAEVLLEYAGKYGAIKNKWHFLTGEKKVIYNIAKQDYLVNAVQDDGTPEGFIHSEALLLVDKQHRIRGIYDGTDSLQVNKLISDITILKTEMQSIQRSR